MWSCKAEPNTVGQLIDLLEKYPRHTNVFFCTNIGTEPTPANLNLHLIGTVAEQIKDAPLDETADLAEWYRHAGFKGGDLFFGFLDIGGG